MKQFKRMILASTLMVGLAGFAVSCKYGDDIDEIRKDIESLRTGQVASVESQLSSLQATVSSLSSAKDALQSTVSSLESQLNDLKGSVATAKDVAAVEAKIADLEKEIAALKSADAVLEEKIAKINETLKDFVTMDDLKATLASYATLDDVAQAVGVVQAALSNYIESNDAALAAAVAELKAAIEEVRNDVKDIAGEVFEAAFQGKFDAAVEAAKLVNAEVLQKEIDAYDAKIKEFITKAIEDNKGAVTEAVAKQINEELAKFKTAVDEILSTVVTSVELYYSYAAQKNPSWNLTFSTVEEQDNVFGTPKDGFDIENPVTFEKGNQIQTPASFVVRVSPVNAQLTPEMITFVNSKGETLDIVTVKSVEPFEELLTRAAGNNGLWTVEAELENYEEKAFKAATTVVGNDKKEHSILFAVQVNNTKDYAERYVTSTYDLTFDWKKFEPASTLDFTVDSTPVAEINNRYTDPSKSLVQETNVEITYEELAWKGAADTEIIPLEKGDKSNVKVDTPDDRSGEEVYPAVQGVPMTISLGEEYENTVRAIYVTLDYKENAVESAPSEWNAWKDYKIDGLNKVVPGTSIDITFTDETAIRDIVGFRVFAVNYDGTLVDPDGKAFYVSLGLEGENWNAVKTVVTPTKQLTGTNDEYSAKKDLAIKTAVNKANISEFTWVTKAVVRNVKWNEGTDGKYVETDHSNKAAVYYGDGKDENGKDENQLFHVAFYKADGTEIFNTSESYSSYPDFSAVASIKTFVNPDIIRKNNKYGVTWASFEDGKEYVGTLTLKDNTGHVLATLNVSMTKELPKAPEGFSIKTNQGPDKNLPWKAYLIPYNGTTESWTAQTADRGRIVLDNLYNPGKGEKAKYVFTFDASQTKTVDGKEVDDVVTVYGDGAIEVMSKYIDNEKEHATKVAYNYGYITSETKTDNAGKPTNELKRYDAEVMNFTTIYNDIYNDTYKWDWAKSGNNLTANAKKAAEVTYSDGNTDQKNGVYEVPLNVIVGKSSHDSKYNAASLEYKVGGVYLLSAKVVSARLYTKDNGLEEYFVLDEENTVFDTKLVFKSISDDTNPNAAVPSILEITYADMYGGATNDPKKVHNHTIKLDVTVKPRVN